MPSLTALSFLTFFFSNILCYALTLPLEPRDDPSLLKCQNYPYEYYPAGVMLPPLDDEPLVKRDSTPIDPLSQIILCTPGTKTYIKLTRKPPNGDLNIDKSDREIQAQITGLIGNTWTFIQREYLMTGKDGVIDNSEGWVLQRSSTHGSYTLQVANAHHKAYIPSIHFGTVRIVGNEVTWGVLQSALSALGTYMVDDDENGWTECEFEIWDGRNQVGTARIIKT